MPKSYDSIRFLIVEGEANLSPELNEAIRQLPIPATQLTRAKSTIEALHSLTFQKSALVLFHAGEDLDQTLDFINAVQSQPETASIIVLSSTPDAAKLDLACESAGADFFLPTTGLTPQVLDRTIRYTLAHREHEEKIRSAVTMKDTFFSLISHDILGPLGTLRSGLKFYHEYFDRIQQQKLRDYLNAAHDSVDHLMALTFKILRWAKAQSGTLVLRPKCVQVTEVLTGSLTALSDSATEKGITIRQQADAGHHVFADTDMLEAILRNVISNAIKFSHPGSQIELSSRTDGAYTYIEVKDQGIGIPPELLEQLFREDSITHRKGTNQETGTGLGLIMSQAFAQRLGGLLTAKSTPGEGSVFTLRLYSDQRHAAEHPGE